MPHIVNAYPDAEVIRVVLDNLNTHKAASLYEAFPPEEARAIARKLAFHYTPKHGSWLNIAEIELAVLSNMCLSQRIPDEPTLRQEIDANVSQRYFRRNAQSPAPPESSHDPRRNRSHPAPTHRMAPGG